MMMKFFVFHIYGFGQLTFFLRGHCKASEPSLNDFVWIFNAVHHSQNPNVRLAWPLLILMSLLLLPSAFISTPGQWWPLIRWLDVDCYLCFSLVFSITIVSITCVITNFVTLCPNTLSASNDENNDDRILETSWSPALYFIWFLSRCYSGWSTLLLLRPAG